MPGRGGPALISNEATAPGARSLPGSAVLVKAGNAARRLAPCATISEIRWPDRKPP